MKSFSWLLGQNTATIALFDGQMQMQDKAPKTQAPNSQAKARQLFVENESIKDIATEIGVSVSTIYNWKSSDKQRGVNWDKLKAVAGNYKLETLAQSLLAQILATFNKLNDELERADLGLIEKMDVLSKAIDGFNKAVNSASKLTPEINKLSVVSEFIEKLTDHLDDELLADVLVACEAVVNQYYAK